MWYKLCCEKDSDWSRYAYNRDFTFRTYNVVIVFPFAITLSFSIAGGSFKFNLHSKMCATQGKVLILDGEALPKQVICVFWAVVNYQ